MRHLIAVAAVSWTVAIVGTASAGVPQYVIYDLGIVNPGDVASQGFGVSDNGIATGRSFGNPTQAFSWTLGGGLVGLPNLASPPRPFSVGNGVNNSGVVVGTGATTSFGSSPLPLIWENGVVSQLPLPVGETLGRANAINNNGVAVGSVGSGVTEFGVIYSGGSATVISQPAMDGSTMRTAFGVNDAGLIAGFGTDPNNAARNVGMLYNMSTNTSFEVGALPGHNGAIAFGVSQAGHVVGSSMLNQGSGTPFIWTQGDGIAEVPLPVGTSQGSARGVNSSGWVVGTASSAFAIPFLFDGTNTYALADLLPMGSGWDLSTNTSSSAMGISEDGTIVGTGIFNGQTRAYAMVLIPAPGGIGIFGLAGLAAIRRRR